MTISDPRADGHDPPAAASDLPDAATLLEAVATFLERDVRGAVDDRGLAFRILIAANLVRVAAREGSLAEAHDDAAFERFRQLFPGAPSYPTDMVEHRRRTLAQFRGALAERLRDDEGWETDALVATAALIRVDLIDELAIVNPRFDTALDIESPAHPTGDPA